MPLFRRKKRHSGPKDQPTAEQAVITHLPLSNDSGTSEERDAVHQLERRIAEAVTALGGEHDGDEFGGGKVVLYTYGPDADRLLEAIRQCLEGFEVRAGAYAIKRYGLAADAHAREERVSLS